ncbi:hypothetical protein GCM10010420_21650 [Streptomyces glaucosporus]|uniref:Uncharacterized protein n=1 Tax=Streptomyces glaucosporus TaxID=284044 RepID=A0ABN3I638_9ACTN
MGKTGGEDEEAARVSRLVGDLLVGLGEKVRAAGVDGVRILTEEELQRHQLNWFRTGWEEHARAAAAERPAPGAGQHPDSEDFPAPPSRLLRFPDRRPPAGARRPEAAEGPAEHGRPDGSRGTYPLPIVGAGEARVRDLMPHRPRSGHRRRRESEGPAGPGGASRPSGPRDPGED